MSNTTTPDLPPDDAHDDTSYCECLCHSRTKDSTTGILMCGLPPWESCDECESSHE